MHEGISDAARLKAETMQELKRMYDCIDVNGDGLVSAEELKNFSLT